jgi:glycolate oxidase iron-sulfur subunit
LPFFVGDSLNYFYPDAGLDVIEVLKENNVEVHIPKAQNCCGIPVLVHAILKQQELLPEEILIPLKKQAVITL